MSAIMVVALLHVKVFRRDKSAVSEGIGTVGYIQWIHLTATKKIRGRSHCQSAHVAPSVEVQ